ncbi:MAG: hypothetical protein GTN53_01350, partial [Candidatus Aminicenantes bacterium]|nr:hypothetical protein [Candidatus Aminicenantes bacterium]NIQ65139.1 hypothetical protein [Candidatus Aminicenantes bacterium]NIT21142.1 hypothetical protein [Candidatus Aminicenantes bacterium]
MFRRALILHSFLFVLSGCIYNDEPLPKITSDYSSKIVQPKLLTPTKKPDFDENIPRNWLPPSRLEKKWIALVIHHSVTENGNATIFDKFHRENKHWEGIGYDFVIGNGTNSGDGQVEVTFRWRNQTIGAHCGGTRGNWANKYAVGICLVGNFNHTTPTMQQMRSLVKLVRFLQNRYGIPKSRIYGHKTTPGARV